MSLRRRRLRSRLYEARFQGTFQSPPVDIRTSDIKKAALRPSDQISIEELDPDRLVLAFGSPGAILGRSACVHGPDEIADARRRGRAP